jgi:hypothetical protein
MKKLIAPLVLGLAENSSELQTFLARQIGNTNVWQPLKPRSQRAE